jgi:hypothetical protein
MNYKIHFKDGTVKEFETLRGADLSGADLRGADLSGANLSGADLRRADLRRANLRCADLRYADLSGADLSSADLSNADLSGAKELLSPADYLAQNFETTTDGYIAYKTFGEFQKSIPESWKIEPGSVLTDVANFTRTQECGCGINVATKNWVATKTEKPEIWKCLIRWGWLPGVCVPYNTDGKIRCERVELVEMIKREDFSGEEADDDV